MAAMAGEPRERMAALLALLEDPSDYVEYSRLPRAPEVADGREDEPPRNVSPYLQPAAEAEEAARALLDTCYPALPASDADDDPSPRGGPIIVSSVRDGALQLCEPLPDLPAFRSKPPTPPMTPPYDARDEAQVEAAGRLGAVLPAASVSVKLRPTQGSSTALPASMTASVVVLSAVEGGEAGEGPQRAARLVETAARMSHLKATRSHAQAVTALQHAAVLAAAVPSLAHDSGASTTSMDAIALEPHAASASPLSSHTFLRSLAPQTVLMVPLSSVHSATNGGGSASVGRGSPSTTPGASSSTRSQRFDLPTPVPALAASDAPAGLRGGGSSSPQSPAGLRAAMPTFSRKRYDAAVTNSGNASGASSPSVGSGGSGVMSPSLGRMSRLPAAMAASGARTSPGTALADRRRFEPITVRIVNGAPEDDVAVHVDAPLSAAAVGAPLRALNVLMRRAGME